MAECTRRQPSQKMTSRDFAMMTKRSTGGGITTGAHADHIRYQDGGNEREITH